ncbi:carboxyvinyl-carboxyphosphonate phosphorylmutase [Caulobacter sp. D4A]|uniref:isocitrate lyase/PEP mutase family protein n=1 Tax=unclassified Caulobacter TaxID=2648921 RepID=UPI000D73D9D6|nr:MULTISPECIES: isocitrate lyase/phosphoenolpyruvate mutase family protein [unclassified Caulobacter]PXA72852.1 carboxyvinyl-carboxyphosphonate phosphorylmutase [Caulobacter sp. D4A]PXA91163.1 carboxyvinyl-carboxyphosphonate phosphorylmutase [Caulobacter sp. D5]
MSLRDRLAQDTPLLAPGAYDALSALLIEQAGFEAIYLSGASIAYTQLGRPDIGLVSFDHVADVVGRVSERVGLPLIVDGDTGFGNAVNVQRTVRIFERMGASAIQLEDQTFPKKCGHLSDKGLVSTQEMSGKIRAALDARASDQTLIIARTDAIGVEGFEAALDRAHAYVEAGADVLFVEAPRSLGEMSAIAHAFAGRVPLLANMVEGGKTPLLDVTELGNIGFKLVISPGALVRALVPTAEAFLASLKVHGATRPFAERMIDMGGVNDRIGLAEMVTTGAAYAAG